MWHRRVWGGRQTDRVLPSPVRRLFAGATLGLCLLRRHSRLPWCFCAEQTTTKYNLTVHRVPDGHWYWYALDNRTHSHSEPFASGQITYSLWMQIHWLIFHNKVPNGLAFRRAYAFRTSNLILISYRDMHFKGRLSNCLEEMHHSV